MTLDDFKATLGRNAPPDLPAPLAALWWWAARGSEGWDRAHGLVQDAPGKDAVWVHAYLHRVEGDLGNAGYWYRRAGQPEAGGPLDAEWEAIAAALLGA